MIVLILVLLLIASILGVLGAVLKAALVIVLSVILALMILVFGAYWFMRHKINRYVRDVEGQQRGYPARGHKGRSLPPE